MDWFCDRTGFPLLSLREHELVVSLWPVFKVQFECFLAQPGGFPFGGEGLDSDSWYQALLEVSPRVSWRHFRFHEREGLLMTGIHPAEALVFLSWCGVGFQLPTVEQWRLVDQILNHTPLGAGDWQTLRVHTGLHPAARAFLRLWERSPPPTWGQLALLHQGVQEWVRSGSSRNGGTPGPGGTQVDPTQGFGGLGRVRPEFHPILLDPQRHPPVTPVRSVRLPWMGFRMFQRSGG